METIWKHKVTGKWEGRPTVLQTDFLGSLPILFLESTVGESILGSAPLEWIRDIREKNGSPDSVTISFFAEMGSRELRKLEGRICKIMSEIGLDDIALAAKTRGEREKRE